MSEGTPTPTTVCFKDDGRFPNNPDLPVLLYRGALAAGADAAERFEQTFHANGWGGCWRWGVFNFHHFHSNAHEALGVASGTARLRLGGPRGEDVDLRAGDLVVLPAGTAHKNESASGDFLVVGAYPRGQTNYDTLRGDPAEHDAAVKRIRSTTLPETDPLYGREGPLIACWHARRRPPQSR